MNRDNINFNFQKEIVTNTPFPSFILNNKGEVVIWNELCEKYFGYSFNNNSNKDHTIIKDSLLKLLPEEAWPRLLNGAEPLRFDEVQLITEDESSMVATLITTPCNIEGVSYISITCLLEQQVTRMNDTTQELIDIKNGLSETLMMVTLDSEGFITNCNQEFLKISHWTPKRVLGKTLWQLFPEKDESSKIIENIWKTICSGQIWHGEVEKVTKDGTSYWVHLTAIPTFSQIEQTYRFILIEKDITNEKNMKLQLEKIAYIDTETGLMNVHRLEQIVTEMIEEGRHFSFVYLSIDKFYTLKELNKNQLQSNLSVEFTKRMKIYFQDSFMARINENDFVVITPLGDWFIQGFLTYLKQNPIYADNMAVPLSISGGITRSPQDQSNFAQLMKASLATIANVREGGGDSILSLSNATHKAINRRSIIEKRLLQALDQQNLKVLYQPQLDIHSGTIEAVEALVRWEDEEIGVISPDELIPIAEETGLINNIGSFMIEEACKQAAQWLSEGLDLKVTINLSVREFRDKNMAKSILNTLARTNCPAHLIQIEFTEKFALEAEAETSIIKQMRKLENEGIVFILDDFGTGYASFRYMQLLPIKTLKIDQTFISSMLQSEKSQRLVHGMIQFGKSMNLKVLAEGVETKEQHELLKEYGCDAVQGFLISKPVSESKISNLMTSQSY